MAALVTLLVSTSCWAAIGKDISNGSDSDLDAAKSAPAASVADKAKLGIQASPVPVLVAKNPQPVTGNPHRLVKTPENETREATEKAARLVLEGKATVSSDGQLHQIRRSPSCGGISSRFVNWKIGSTKEYATDVAEAARSDARRHADVVAGEAIRKSAVTTNKALSKSYRYTNSLSDRLSPAIGGAANWGRIAVVLAVIALGLSVWTFFRPRTIYADSEY